MRHGTRPVWCRSAILLACGALVHAGCASDPPHELEPDAPEVPSGRRLHARDTAGGSPDEHAIGRYIIAIAGQSNAVGWADIDSATARDHAAAYPGVQVKQQDGTNTNPPVWTTHATGDLQPRAHATRNMGSELSLGRYVDARLPGAFAIAKIGIGDTGLNDHWKKTSAYPTEAPRLFDQMIAFLEAAEGELGGPIAAFVWIQGEKDARDAGDAAAYEANLAQLIADVRERWPAVPVIFNRLHASNPDAHRAAVRSAQASVDALVSGTTLIDVDDLALQLDRLHLTADSYVTLGDRIGKAVLGALDINTLLPRFSTSVARRQVTVTDASTDDDGAVVAWSYDWGDGSAPSTARDPSHTYAADGTYTIRLTATDSSGASAAYEAQVTVVEPTWSIDATSHKGVPADATEWAALAAAHAPALRAPDHLWLFQEASGKIADVVGGKPLTSAGAPSYREAVPGWTRQAAGASGAASNQTLNNTSMPNVNASSSLLLVYAEIARPAVTHQRVFHGAPSGNAFEGLAGTANMRLRTGPAIANGTSSHAGGVRPYVLRYDRAHAVNALYSDAEKVAVAFRALSGAEVRFTLGLSTDPAAETRVLYAALWTGAAAERSDAEIRSMLEGLGWTVTGW